MTTRSPGTKKPARDLSLLRAANGFPVGATVTESKPHPTRIPDAPLCPVGAAAGKPVGPGDPNFTIYRPDLVATEQDFLLALKARSLLRESTLASSGQGSENLIAAARERLRLWDVSDREIQSLETEGKVKRAIAVYSPVTGVVMERAAYHHGTFVDPSKDLFTIVDLSQVWVLGEAYETDLPFIRTGQAADIELPYSGAGRNLHRRS